MPDHLDALALIDAHPLGAWVTMTDDGLVANHIPFVLDKSQGKFGTLLGHVSRANRVWEQLSTSAESIVMFQGPQSYITPGWYPSKQKDGKVVPTWNYSVAHVHGVARAVDDRGWLHRLLEQLTAANESSRTSPWKITDAPSDYIDKMIRAVVGIEIPIARLVGKLKVSQDEPMQDRLGTVTGLRTEGGEDAVKMASLVKLAIDQHDRA